MLMLRSILVFAVGIAFLLRAPTVGLAQTPGESPTVSSAALTPIEASPAPEAAPAPASSSVADDREWLRDALIALLSALAGGALGAWGSIRAARDTIRETVAAERNLQRERARSEKIDRLEALLAELQMNSSAQMVFTAGEKPNEYTTFGSFAHHALIDTPRYLEGAPRELYLAVLKASSETAQCNTVMAAANFSKAPNPARQSVLAAIEDLITRTQHGQARARDLLRDYLQNLTAAPGE